MSLPPFSGDVPTCAKCGYEGATTEYRSHSVCLHTAKSVMPSSSTDPNERLHRECLRCGYPWDEAIEGA